MLKSVKVMLLKILSNLSNESRTAIISGKVFYEHIVLSCLLNLIA